MASASDKTKVIAVDLTNEGVLVHFSNGLSVLYHAKFLYDVREDDGNVPIPDEDEEQSKPD